MCHRIHLCSELMPKPWTGTCFPSAHVITPTWALARTVIIVASICEHVHITRIHAPNMSLRTSVNDRSFFSTSMRGLFYVLPRVRISRASRCRPLWEHRATTVSPCQTLRTDHIGSEFCQHSSDCTPMWGSRGGMQNHSQCSAAAAVKCTRTASVARSSGHAELSRKLRTGGILSGSTLR